MARALTKLHGTASPALFEQAGARTRILERRVVLAICLLALLRGLLYVVLIPPWEHYDEPTHFEYAALIAATGHLPEPGAADTELRGEVERLLAAHRNAGRFGESPVFIEEAPVAAAIDTTPPAGARATRVFVAIAWLVAAATAAVFAYAAWLLVQRGATVQWFGWEVGPRGGGWYVTAVDPAGALEDRRQIAVEIAGVPFAPGDFAPAGSGFAKRLPVARHVGRDDEDVHAAIEREMFRDGQRGARRGPGFGPPSPPASRWE